VKAKFVMEAITGFQIYDLKSTNSAINYLLLIHIFTKTIFVLLGALEPW
jgi:hypothetical protein